MRLTTNTRIRRSAAATIVVASIAVAGVAGATPTAELARLDALYAQADPESPARFRLLEERQRLMAGDVQSELSQWRAIEDGRA